MLRVPLALTVALGLIAATGSAHAQKLEPRSPVVWESFTMGASLPHQTVGFGTGLHGWWRDYLFWGGRVVGNTSFRHVDLDHNGIDDYDPREDGLEFEAQLDVGVPLSWRLRSGMMTGLDPRKVPWESDWVGEVVQVSVVSGARISIPENIRVGLPLGLRWSKHRVLDQHFSEYYRERWIQARALWFPQAGKVGFDAEAVWMPFRGIALSAYGERIPVLDFVGGRTCSDHYQKQLCTASYPITSFNPIAEHAYLQVGLRIRLTFAL